MFKTFLIIDVKITEEVAEKASYMLKEEFPTDKPWFRDISALLDLGYQGVQKDYEGEKIEIPVKKPRKSKANPEPKLSEEDKEKNRALSKIRIFIENAIGGIKRYNILNHPFRNKIEYLYG